MSIKEKYIGEAKIKEQPKKKLSLKIADNAVTSRTIANGAVGTSKIADNAITTDKIGDGQVKTNDIADKNVTTPKLADGAVTLSKLAPDVIVLTNSITVEGNIKQVRFGHTVTLVLNLSTTNALTGSWKIVKNGNETFTHEGNTWRFENEVDGKSTFSIECVQGERKYTKEYVVEEAYPYYGGGGNSWDEIATRSHELGIVTPNGDISNQYTIVVPQDGQKIWLIVPSSVAVSSIKMGGIDVPKDVTTQNITLHEGGKTKTIEYKIYSSVNTYNAGTYSIQVNEYEGADKALIEELINEVRKLPNTHIRADEEDIELVETNNSDGTKNGVIQLKDKAYSPANFSGLGRKYLRKNIVNGKNVLTEGMLNKANTIYHIQYDFDLNGATLIIPKDCVLQFDGGSLTNGLLVGDNTLLSGCKDNCLKGLTFGGIFRDMTLEASWLGLLPNGDGTTEGTPNQQDGFDKLSQLIACTRTITVNFRKGYYGYGGGAEGLGMPWGTADPNRRTSLPGIWYGYYAIELWDDYTGDVGQKSGSRMHNYWGQYTVLRTDNLIINGNNAYFLNVYPYKVGAWRKLEGADSEQGLVKTNPVGKEIGHYIEAIATQGGGLIGIYTWKTLNLKVNNLTQDHNMDILEFGGRQYLSQGQLGLYFESYGDVYIDGCTFKNNVTDGITISSRSATLGTGANKVRKYLYPNKVVIKNTTLENCIRQGISITGGSSVLIDNCVFNYIGQIKEIGTKPLPGESEAYPYKFESPWAAIDIEPVPGSGRVEDVIVRNCRFFNINHYCIVSGLQDARGIIITGCHAENQLIADDGNYCRNRNDGFHAPSLSYGRGDAPDATDGYGDDIFGVYESDGIRYDSINYTRFVNIRSALSISIDDITLINVNYGYADVIYMPDRYTDRPKSYQLDAKGRLGGYYLSEHDGIPVQVGTITAQYTPIMKSTIQYYDFDLGGEAFNPWFVKTSDDGFEGQWNLYNIDGWSDYTNYSFGRRHYGNLSFSVCHSFQFRGKKRGSGHSLSTIDNLNVYIEERLTAQLFNTEGNGYAYISTEINNLNIIDSTRGLDDPTQSKILLSIPEVLAGRIHNLKVINNQYYLNGIAFADSFNTYATSYGKTALVPARASYLITDDGKSDGQTRRKNWVGVLQERYDAGKIPEGDFYMNFKTKFNFEENRAPVIFSMGIVASNTSSTNSPEAVFGMPLKAVGFNSISNLSALKAILPGTHLRRLLYGETIYDRSRNQFIIGNNSLTDFRRWDGNPYGTAEYGGYKEYPNGVNIRIGTTYYNSITKRLSIWNGISWVDERGQTPALRKGSTYDRPKSVYRIKTVSGNLPSGGLGWSFYSGYTIYKEGGSTPGYYVIQDTTVDPRGIITWNTELEFANTDKHIPAGRGSITAIPGDVVRSGTTEERPIASYAYEHLYIGFEFYDTTLGKYVYIEDVTEDSITWGRRAHYGSLIPNQDEGYEYFDTDLNKFIYAKEFSNKGVVTWVEKDGAKAGVLRRGTFANKPAGEDIYVGFKYFCTDKHTPEAAPEGSSEQAIAAANGIEIIYKGNDTWVDALGRVIS